MTAVPAAATLAQTRQLALELHRVLRDMDPARFRAEAQRALDKRLAELGVRVRAMLEGSIPATDGLRVRLHSLAEALAERQLSTREQWMELRRRLAALYEDLANALREYAVHVPALRPTNYKRNLFHVASAAFALSIVVLAPEHMLTVAAGFMGTGWFMEATRRMHPRVNAFYLSFLGPVAHPHEHYRVNSATWYVTALVILATFFTPAQCAVAVITLGVGDPIAAIVGRRWGKTKLLHGRSLEGSAAFVVAAAAVTLLALRALYPELALGLAAASAFGGGLFGAVAELLSRRVDDNLTIPVAAAAGAALAALALG